MDEYLHSLGEAKVLPRFMRVVDIGKSRSPNSMSKIHRSSVIPAGTNLNSYLRLV